jgi:poly-gamma-glutamate capsule biosynthesis protein CapA/YwtB (metallophosphatase superfamily)
MSRGSLRIKAVPLLLAALLPLAASGLQAQSSHSFTDASGDVTMALTGDAIISRRLSPFQEPAFLRMVETIRGADVAFTNLEILLHEYEPDVIPASQSGGTYMAARPQMAQELAWAGFDVVSMANNHTMDYSVGGMRSTQRAVDAAGLVGAGVGEHLAEARAPGYLETPAGRVALISIASTFADHMRAGAQRKDVRGRPGLSPLRHSTTYVVPRTELDMLRNLRETLGMRGRDEADRVSFLGGTFVAGDAPGTRTRANPADLAEIVAAVKDAKRQANWVIVSSHSHEGAGDREVPADFVKEAARAVVDAGADVFVAHGPHVLRGIEIYKGKPIFYSLGNFIFQNETVELQPADNYEAQDLAYTALPSEFYDAREQRSQGGWPADPMYWEAVVAVPSFRAGRLHEILLYPVTLGHGLPRPQRGRPMLADPELGRKIIGDLQRMSEPFGTRIDFVDGVGRVRIGGAGTDRP